MSSEQDYRSYLLRLWRVGQAAQTGWRALLERVDTGEQRSFASLEEAFEYLRQSLSSPPAALPQQDEGGGSINDWRME